MSKRSRQNPGGPRKTFQLPDCSSRLADAACQRRSQGRDGGAFPLIMAMAKPDVIAFLAVAATVCGSITSSLRRRAWRPRRITAKGAVMTLAGGGLMGVASRRFQAATTA